MTDNKPYVWMTNTLLKKIDHEYPLLDDLQVIRIVDGDTIRFKITKEVVAEMGGFGVSTRVIHEFEDNFRLKDGDTPEIRGKQREVGLFVKYFVEALIYETLNDEFYILTYKGKTRGKYGRWLFDLCWYEDEGNNRVIKSLSKTLEELHLLKKDFTY